MKVYIGGYKSWIGPYQIAKSLLFFLPKVKNSEGFEDDMDIVHDFGTWLAEDKNGEDSWLTKFCLWVESKRKRKIKVKIHNYDTWSMDYTLSHIIHPMLIQLHKTKHGAPFVDDEDVPEELRSTSAPPKENEWDTDGNHFKRWDWVLEEMIWAFGELSGDKPGEDRFYSKGEGTDKKADINDYISKIKVDEEGLKSYQDRMANGFRLFGKYFQALWD